MNDSVAECTETLDPRVQVKIIDIKKDIKIEERTIAIFLCRWLT